MGPTEYACMGTIKIYLKNIFLYVSVVLWIKLQIQTIYNGLKLHIFTITCS